MQFITGNSRHQTYFSTLEDQVGPDNAVRIIDAFVDKPDLQQLGFKTTVHKSEGRPPYAPGVLLKLYLYGYLNKIRSSRKLEKEPACGRQVHTQYRTAMASAKPSTQLSYNSRLQKVACSTAASYVQVVCTVYGRCLLARQNNHCSRWQ